MLINKNIEKRTCAEIKIYNNLFYKNNSKKIPIRKIIFTINPYPT